MGKGLSSPWAVVEAGFHVVRKEWSTSGGFILSRCSSGEKQHSIFKISDS